MWTESLLSTHCGLKSILFGCTLMSVCINEKDHTCQVISAHIVAVMTAPYVMRAVKKGHYIPTTGKECSTENPAWWSQSCNRDWKGHGGRETLRYQKYLCSDLYRQSVSSISWSLTIVLVKILLLKINTFNLIW
jgi:hypothetical protein